MGSILDIDNTLEIDNENIEIHLAKKRLFTYLYNFAPNGILNVHNCDTYKWSRQAFNFEIDHETYNLLKNIGAIQPASQSNMFYNITGVQLPSKFCKTIKVPAVFVKIHKKIILEYLDWIEQERGFGYKYNERLNIALKDLYDHMMEFYNQFNKNIENE